jgi:predicted ATPase
MRLLQIALNGQYKGLKDQSFHFNRTEGNIFALIGLNGSGKSQLLELIAEAFAYLERWQRDEFISGKGLGFGVTLHYKWDLRHDIDVLSRYDGLFDYSGSAELKVSIETNGRIHVAVRQDGDWILLQDDERNIPIPQVVGYASGLNENLQRSFMKNAVQQFEVRRVSANRQKELSGKVDEKRRADINQKYVEKYPHIFSSVSGAAFDQGGYLDVVEVNQKASQLIYIDYDNVGLLLLSLAVLPLETVQDLFSEVTFNRLHKAVIRYDLRTGIIEEDAIRDVKMLIRIAGEERVHRIGQTTTPSQYEMYELDYLAGEITLDLLDQGLLERLREANYDDPLTFFKRLYNIQQLGIKNWSYSVRQELRRCDFFGAVKKPLKTKLPLSIVELLLEDNIGNTVSLDDLSDGEAQLIQIMSAAFIFSRSQALFLFDEPETHLNPSWRTYFHSHLLSAISLGNKADKSSQIFLSTHSPFMISSLKRENVRFFERDNDGLISMEPAFSQTYGAAFDVLIKEYYGLRSLISQSVVEDIKQRLPAGNQSDDAFKASRWIEENLGDSMEKAYLLRKLQ